MNITPSTDRMEQYLKSDSVVDWGKGMIRCVADHMTEKAGSEIEFIKAAYEFVRDGFPHSADAEEEAVTCAASDVLKAGHGICFAKSHLLAALLRAGGVPAGFCYQKILLDDETAPVLIYHGVNGVYVSQLKKWIRLDTRGNKKGVNAQFSTEREQLAFPVRPELGEEDGFVVYPDPAPGVLEKMRKYSTTTELFADLPTGLGYEERTGE